MRGARIWCTSGGTGSEKNTARSYTVGKAWVGGMGVDAVRYGGEKVRF